MKSATALAAALASAIAIPAFVLAAEQIQHSTANTKEENIHCYGVNKCKGVSDCGGKGHSCSGQNACKGQGFLEMSKDLCLKIEGGRLTANAEGK